MPPSSFNNYSTLLKFLYQELLSAESHDSAKENLLSYFRETGCDDRQLDILNASFQKATLDTNAFRARSGGEELNNVAPSEFSQRLVSELTKKYKDTQELSRRITNLEEICLNDSSSLTSNAKQLPLSEAINQFSHSRLSSLNLEAAMIQICEGRLRSHVKGTGLHGGGDGGCASDNRHTSAYDEQVLILRKKLRVSILVWRYLSFDSVNINLYSCPVLFFFLFFFIFRTGNWCGAQKEYHKSF